MKSIHTHTPITLNARPYDATARSVKERIFHALLFEFAALLISAPLFALLTGRPITDVGLMTLIIGTIAITWNFIYNTLFDRMTRSFIKERTLRIRLIHAVLFELGLIVMTIPLIAEILTMSWKEAFILDIGIILFFLPYTVVFNWGYDFLRKALWMRRQNLAR